MKNLSLSLLILVFISTGLSGQSNLDSLWLTWDSSEEPDSVRYKAISDISTYYLYTNPDSCLHVAKLHLNYAEEKKNIQEQSFALSRLGGAFLIKADPKEASKYLILGLEKGKKVKDTSAILMAMGNLGVAVSMLGDGEKGLKYFKECPISFWSCFFSLYLSLVVNKSIASA